MIKIYTDGATSNNGKENARGGWAFAVVNNNNEIVSELKTPSVDYNSDDFINKIDEIIVFDNLDKKTVEKIIKNRINELVNKYDIQIHYDNTIIDEIINMSEYKLYGASKINHIINNKINNLIINELINNNKKIHLTTINM